MALSANIPWYSNDLETESGGDVLFDFVGVEGDDGDSQLIGQLDRFGFIDDDRLPGLDSQYAATRFVHRADRLNPDCRDIKAAILIGLGHLDDCESAATAQFGRTANAAIGSLDGLDGNDCHVIHHD